MNEKKLDLEKIKLICETCLVLEKVKSSCDAVLKFEERKSFKTGIHDLQSQVLNELANE
jgi:hypothetical protein